MTDLTVLYYTANLISEGFSRNIREHLVQVCGGAKIISISHKPMDFGENIVVDMPIGVWSIYKQVLLAAQRALTKYVACAEDDVLHHEDHFRYRPPDAFAYNPQRWNIYKGQYIYRKGLCMSTCIAPRDLMVATLEKRFAKYPDFLDKQHTRGFCEPGRAEADIGLEPVPMTTFSTEVPPVVFWHRPSMGGVRKLMRRDKIATELPYWGPAQALWNRVYVPADKEVMRRWYQSREDLAKS